MDSYDSATLSPEYSGQPRDALAIVLQSSLNDLQTNAVSPVVYPLCAGCLWSINAFLPVYKEADVLSPLVG